MNPYQSLATIGEAVRQITEEIESLKAEGLLLPEFAEIRRLAIQQLRAEVSHAATMSLAGRELENATAAEKQRIEREGRLKGE